MQSISLPSFKGEGCQESRDDQGYRRDLGQVPSIGPQFHHMPGGLNQMTSGDPRYHQVITQSQGTLPLQRPASHSSDLSGKDPMPLP